ncbi:hypothetical protein SUGI_0463850 [Cryptomeria japonica]|uniref:uncharacterized protein LOC131067323 n=1 Tax=Cryptomeria japonica TaxID=3369 RepID=UPI002408B3D4|nr:uncharacterized protein LOC131067323 [Cryptomeria japonica]GLJ24311.1 hypothetical protein SUGI_0463850 [Cryptomeria japonica]
MSTAEASASVKKEDQEISGNPKGGELLFCGATMWEAAGRKNVDFSSTNLVSPVRLTSLMGINITFVAAGCASNHCVALDVEGRCYTWGRNDKGQLGHGDLVQRDKPTLVSGLSNLKIVKAGGGKHHTVVVAADESSFTFGWNKHGQLGTGSTKNEVESSPVRCLVTQVTNAVCGADFTLWLSTVPGSTILTAGLPQYGQLGHGTDNEYNAKESAVKLAYEAQPRPRAIASLSAKTITKVACGSNHTVAVDSDGFVYTWGYGGYGRLGHREQKDEWTPRLVEMFQRSNVLPPTAVVAAGSAHSACTAGGGQLYMWGRVKQTGDNWMYPKPVFDLSGWNIRCIDFGYTHNICGADDSCIGWGVSQNGELGFGPLGPKSSANPKKIDILDGMHVLSVACGFSHSLIVVDRTILADRIEKLEIFDGERPSQDDIEVEEEVPAKNTPVSKSGKKRKGASDDVPVEASVKSEKKPRKKASKKKYSSNSDNSDDDGGDDDDTFSEEDANGSSKSHSKSRGRGRGRGASRGASTGRGKSSRGRGKGKGAKSGKAR